MTYLERYPLTERQALWLIAVSGNKKRSVRETSELLGVRLRHSNYPTIRALIKKGVLAQDPALRCKFGSYHVTSAGRAWLKKHREEYRGRCHQKLRRRPDDC